MSKDDPRDKRPKRRGLKGPDRDERMRCTAHKKDGSACLAYAIRGGNVCNKHGGSAPQVKRKAQETLASARYWLVKELLKIAKSAESEGVRLAAIRDALDRAGMSTRQHIDIDVQASWESGFEGVVWAHEEGDDDAEAELLALRAEVKQLRAITAGHVQSSGEVLEGRVVEPGEAGYGPGYGPLGAA